MNRTFNATPAWVRPALAIAAVASTVLVFSAIEGLVLHYEAGAHLASTAPTVVAHR